MTATLALKGEHIRPRLVKQMGDQEIPIVKEGEYQGFDQNWDFVHSSMRDVVHSLRGTAASLGRKMKYEIAGKTGTAQVVGIAQGEKYDSESLAEAYRDHTLFVGFAPADKPEVALAVIVENGEKHGKTTFPVVKAVFDQYFKTQQAMKKKAEKKDAEKKNAMKQKAGAS